MKRKLTAGQTSVSLPIFIQDTSSTTGGGLSGVTFASSGLVIEYRRRGQSSWTTSTPVTKTLGTFVSWGIVADGSLSGAYELDLPDAAFASGARWVVIRVRGVTNMLPVLIEIELDVVDYQVAAGGAVMPTVAGRTLDVSTAGAVTLAPLDSSSQHAGTAQAGAAGTITLASGASATDNLYRGNIVKIYSGTGAGQTRTITGYVGSTKVATVGRNWATNPDATSLYSVLADQSAVLNDSLQVVAGSVATGGIVAASFAAGAIDAAAIATDAIGSNEVSAAAVTKIQNGLATPTNITAGTITTATNVTTVNGLAAGVITAASIAADAITDAKVASDVTIDSVTGAVGSVASGVTVTTNNDKTGYGLSSAAVQAIWDALTSALTTVGSVGKLIVDLAGRVVGTIATGTHNPQTGDSFARLGAPANASISADIALKLPTASYTAPLDAAGTRAALGLGSANLDTQLDALPTNAELATALGTADDATLAAIAAEAVKTAAIKAKTDNLPSDPADASDIAASFSTVNGTLATLATAANLATVAGYLDTEIAAILAVAVKLDTMLELDGAVYRLTVNALEQAPSGGGGGSTDWTADERTALRTILGIPASGTTPEAPSAGALKVIDDLLDTEMAALTTAVADIPTNAELATALASADDATLAAIAAEAVKTAAIKAKADLITTTPATAIELAKVVKSGEAITHVRAGKTDVIETVTRN